jgi:anti-anti-sigma regulatory factor
MSHLYLCPSSGPGTLRVAVIGRLDRQTSDAFTASLSLMLRDYDPAPKTILVNLRCCTAMDADGLTALERMRDAMRDAGGTLRLEDVPPLLENLVSAASGQPLSSPESH